MSTCSSLENWDLGFVKFERVWFVGEWRAEILENAVAVVGSRRMSGYGKRCVERLVGELSENRQTIVSGFMYGVDMTAHEIALEMGAKTIAVLGWGVEWQKISDPEKKILQRIVDSGGMVISLWQNQAPTLWTFPARNRLVAAISSKVYVVEASSKSGSLLTANMAIKFGKEVIAIPGEVFSKLSFGTNQLISEGKAKMWLPYQSTQLVNHKSDIVRNTLEDLIYTKLQYDPMSIDELCRELGKSSSEIGGVMTMMLIKGLVEERYGKYYTKD